MKTKSMDTFKNQEGEQVYRVVLDVPGRDVQIVNYDNAPIVYVKIDGDMVRMQVGEIDSYLAARLGDVQ